MKRRPAVALLLLTLLAVLGAGHWLFWYQPRARAMPPRASQLLPRSQEPGLRLWIPYPHQNLGALEREVEDLHELLAATARLAGLPPPTVPRLEPFGYPPARELQLSAGPNGRGLAAELLPYPSVRHLARLSGALAANPWLAGGEAEARGRRWQVRWEGPIWRAEEDVGGFHAGDPGPATAWALEEPVLAVVELSRPSPPLPAGRYRVLRERGALVISSVAEGVSRRPSAEPLFAQQELTLLFLRQRPGEGLEGLVLFDLESGLAPGFPAAAALGGSRRARDLLPGGRPLSRLGRLPLRQVGESTLVATDARALELAAELVPGWLRLASQEAGGGLEMGLWVAPGAAAQRSRRLLRFLEGFPLTSADELQRWRDASHLLEVAAQHYGLVELWATAEVAELRAVPFD